ncbi:hypothetical protein Mapa_002121 [Marchantia paleacea]|nr:hypothetical protein Mapa_002121 [Marchantia paleacea]
MKSCTCMCLLSILGLLLLTTVTNADNDTRLDLDYYSETCPNATSIVKQMVKNIVAEKSNMAGGLLRLHFHDCFVKGCDASVLLNSTDTNAAEKDAPSNSGIATLRGYDHIDNIKAAIEADCPGIVSCSDILALAARDATVLVGGLNWSVALGRKDGLVSNESEATELLPSFSMTYDELVENFAAVGFSQGEMVVLSGGHTIGRASCLAVWPRLYDFNGVAGQTDPSIDSKLAVELKKQCPQNQTGSILSMDSTENTFDNLYFKAVLANKGLFQSDANLLANPVGKKLVEKYSKRGATFKRDFAAAMEKMSNIRGALEGQIRRVCTKVNRRPEIHDEY